MFKKSTSKIKKGIIIAFIIFVVVNIIFFTLYHFNIYFGYGYGDLASQHITFLDNLRINFSSTGDLFPQWNMNLGLGSSFVNYYYHWSMNIWTFVSYLFPFGTLEYLIFLRAIISALLFLGIYILLGYYSSNEKNKIIISVLFAQSGVVSAMFSIHPIFILSLPFVAFILIGCHKLVNEKSVWLFITSFVLLVLSAFGTVLTVGFLSLFYTMVIADKQQRLRIFLKLTFCYTIIIAISAIYLLPFFLRVLAMSRAYSEEATELLLLNQNIFYDLSYNEYTFFLGLIPVFIIVYNLFLKDKMSKMLSLFILGSLLFLPVQKLLNYWQYAESKMIIPLLCVLPILFIKYMEDEDNKRKSLFCYIVALVTLGYVLMYRANNIVLSNYHIISIMILAVLSFVILFYAKRNYKKMSVAVFGFILCLFYMTNVPNTVGFFQYSSLSSNNMEKNDIKNAKQLYRINTGSSNKVNSIYSFSLNVYSSVISNSLADILANDLPIERGRSLNEAKFYNSSLTNILFGVRNNHHGDISYPIVRGTYDVVDDSSIPESKLNKMVSFVSTVFVENSENKYEDKQKIKRLADTEYSVIRDYTILDSRFTDANDMLDFDENSFQQDGVLLLQMDISETDKSKTVAIEINEHMNTRYYEDHKYYNGNDVFYYMTNVGKGWKLKIRALEADYKIKDIQYIFLTNDEVRKLVPSFVKAKNIKINHNSNFRFSLNMEKDGYLVTSIPYDNGYSITVNGQAVEVERVNNNYIGAKLEKGNNKVKIKYNIPGHSVGKKVSAVGIVVFVVYVVISKRRCNDSGKRGKKFF